MVAEVALPTEDSEADAAHYDQERGEVGGFGAATGRVQVPVLATPRAAAPGRADQRMQSLARAGARSPVLATTPVSWPHRRPCRPTHASHSNPHLFWQLQPRGLAPRVAERT